jgi:hypothetical protein
VTRLVALLLAVVAAVALATTPAGAGTPATIPPTTIAENPFVPENENIGDCVSALPRPECGSEARGGWRQALVFGVVLAGGAFIAWRVVRNVRRRQAPAGRASASYTQPAQTGDGVRGRSPRGERAP